MSRIPAVLDQDSLQKQTCQYKDKLANAQCVLCYDSLC